MNRPIVADLDARGDLYVADSSGSNDKVAQQLETRPHRIVRLRDQDGDGLYDSSVVFADGLMFPEGILCYQGLFTVQPLLKSFVSRIPMGMVRQIVGKCGWMARL